MTEDRKAKALHSKFSRGGEVERFRFVPGVAVTKPGVDSTYATSVHRPSVQVRDYGSVTSLPDVTVNSHGSSVIRRFNAATRPGRVLALRDPADRRSPLASDVGTLPRDSTSVTLR